MSGPTSRSTANSLTRNEPGRHRGRGTRSATPAGRRTPRTASRWGSCPGRGRPCTGHRRLRTDSSAVPNPAGSGSPVSNEDQKAGESVTGSVSWDRSRRRRHWVRHWVRHRATLHCSSRVSIHRSNLYPTRVNRPTSRKPKARCSAVEAVSPSPSPSTAAHAVVGDDGDHLTRSGRLASGQQRTQQEPPDASCRSRRVRGRSSPRRCSRYDGLVRHGAAYAYPTMSFSASATRNGRDLAARVWNRSSQARSVGTASSNVATVFWT